VGAGEANGGRKPPASCPSPPAPNTREATGPNPMPTELDIEEEECIEEDEDVKVDEEYEEEEEGNERVCFQSGYGAQCNCSCATTMLSDTVDHRDDDDR
jgi:hypothetical protein